MQTSKLKVLFSAKSEVRWFQAGCTSVCPPDLRTTSVGLPVPAFSSRGGLQQGSSVGWPGWSPEPNRNAAVWGSAGCPRDGVCVALVSGFMCLSHTAEFCAEGQLPETLRASELLSTRWWACPQFAMWHRIPPQPEFRCPPPRD